MFDAIIGQERAKETLGSMVESGKIPHALLFAGPRGVGKGETARDLARMLLCGNGLSSGCTDCNSCRRAGALAHPDLHVLFPFKGKPEKKDMEAKWLEGLQDHRRLIADEPYPMVVYEKGAQIVAVLVDEVRERLLESSFEGGRRVCVILSADKLNPTTGNRLLKVLEEPPDDVHFILTTERVSSVLPTIVSRTTVIRFRRLTVSEIAGYLERYPELTPEERMSCALRGDGDIKAARAAAFEHTADLHEQAFEMYKGAALGNPDSVAVYAAPFLWSREELEAEELIAGFARWTRAVVGCRTGSENIRDSHSDAVRELAGRTDIAALGRLAKCFENGIEMLGRHVNISLVMTKLLYTIHDTYR